MDPAARLRILRDAGFDISAAPGGYGGDALSRTYGGLGLGRGPFGLHPGLKGAALTSATNSDIGTPRTGTEDTGTGGATGDTELDADLDEADDPEPPEPASEEEARRRGRRFAQGFVEEEDGEAEVVRLFGIDWMRDHGVRITSEDCYPGLEAGWMICTLCEKQLAGHWTCVTHFESRIHRRNLAFRRAQAKILEEIQDHLRNPQLALPAPAGFRTASYAAAAGWRRAPLASVAPSSPGMTSTAPWSPHPSAASMASRAGVRPPSPPPGVEPPPPPPPPPPPASPGQPGPTHGLACATASAANSWSSEAVPPEAVRGASQAHDSTAAPAPAAAAVVACQAYDAVEVSEDGLPEPGYLAVKKGDGVRVLSAAEPGHSRNRYSDYVYARTLLDAQAGWLPTSCIWPDMAKSHGHQPT
eukprot:TRINITY_DN1073_c0_g1_i1.p1 TRINITY_DN1073_c0_g1~~TRINITY_DN1073_c0_g1_i1.p1  ORF type:complete len:415 (+),score=79.37 TRINITY_DN1073_c0_g1_i1:48-1292(+)